MTSAAPPDRRARPDAETPEALVLVKYAGALHATRQIRTLAARAEASGKHLVVIVQRGFRPASSLRIFMANHPDLIRLEQH
jgi:nucleotide-binding universal stress UspA family protein